MKAIPAKERRKKTSNFCVEKELSGSDGTVYLTRHLVSDLVTAIVFLCVAGFAAFLDEITDSRLLIYDRLGTYGDIFVPILLTLFLAFTIAFTIYSFVIYFWQRTILDSNGMTIIRPFKRTQRLLFSDIEKCRFAREPEWGPMKCINCFLTVRGSEEPLRAALAPESQTISLLLERFPRGPADDDWWGEPTDYAWWEDPELPPADTPQEGAKRLSPGLLLRGIGQLVIMLAAFFIGLVAICLIFDEPDTVLSVYCMAIIFIGPLVALGLLWRKK